MAAMDPVVPPTAPMDPMTAAPAAVAAPTIRGFDDIRGQRDQIYASGIRGIQAMKPVANATHRIEVADVGYDDDEFDPLPADEKKALLQQGSLHRPLKGTIRLVDQATNTPVDEQRVTLAHVPHLNRQGLFIRNGVLWGLRNQLRLRPGMYTRKKKSGEIETHVNTRPGTGRGFRILLEPETGLFKMQVEQSSTRLYPLLRAMGVDDDQIKKTWGEELYNKNYRPRGSSDSNDLTKVLQKLGPRDTNITDETLKPQALREILNRAEVDEDVTELTMGERFKHLSPERLLQATNKVLGVARGTEKEDNRDSQAFQTIHSAEDFVEERLKRDQAGTMRKLLWKAGRDGKLGNIPSGLLNKNLAAMFEKSGLGATLETINPFEIHDTRQGITRLGQGGIPSEDSVSRDARNVQASYLGVIDSSRGPESSRLGLDLRVTDAAKKGSDNLLYTTVRNVRTGEMETVSARDLAKKIVTFPGEYAKESKRIPAVKDDKLDHVRKEDVDYEIVNPGDLMSRATSMIPFPESMKGQRLLMGARFMQQAMPLRGAEAPLVQTAGPDGASMHKQMGESLGAARSPLEGVVTKVTPDAIHISGADGTKKVIGLYNNYPYSRKTSLHSTPTVQVGSYVKSGDLLAKSNFTDDNGVTAIGVNLRTAWMSAEAATLEDAVVISESAAKKLTSEAMYKSDLDLTGIHSTKKDDYTAIYGPRFTSEQLGGIGDDGVIKEGATVNPGDPMILAIANKPKRGVGAVMNSPRSAFSDKTETWEHNAPGVVTDVTRTKGGVRVTVKSYDTTHLADKLCYSSDTEVLTRAGWKSVTQLTIADEIATLAEDSKTVYLPPVAIHSYDHQGDMYAVDTTQVSLRVTLNHKLYATKNIKATCPADYALYPAAELLGTTYRLRNNCDPVDGVEPEFFDFAGEYVKAGQFGRGTRFKAGARLGVDTFMMLLGMFLSEGNVVWQPESGSYGVDITQIKPASRAKMLAALDASGLKYNRLNRNQKIRIHEKSIARLFRTFHTPGDKHPAHSKFIPDFVFSYSPRLLRILFDWLMWGDGHRASTFSVYTTTSLRLAGDMQRLALHLGFAANIRYTAPKRGVIKGKEYNFAARYDVIFYLSKNRPTINHGHVHKQKAQSERIITYDGKVYCPQMPCHHIIYVRRDGKAIWCGNSGRFGNKGVVSKVVPDEQMPHDEQGRPIEQILNAFGVTSRVNPAVLAEALLGKVAQKTGQPYIMKSFSTPGGVADFALAEAEKHGVVTRDPKTGEIVDTETLTDPRDGRKIPGIFTGTTYTLKLHHMAESKLSARDQAGYTTEGLPAKGGSTGAKRIGLLDSHSLLSAGATEFLKDAKLVRGQRNDDYWRDLRNGETPQTPAGTLAGDLFDAQLAGAGVNLKKSGSRSGLSPLLDRDVDKLAQHEITEPDTFNFETMEPVKGGLFDIAATGGADGNRFSKITLPVKIPHPLFVEPIQRILGFTGKEFEAVLSGKEKIHGKTGPEAIETALKGIDIDKEIGAAKAAIKGGRKTLRDDAVKKLGYLTGLKKIGITPDELMVSKIPVIPPQYRPISQARGVDMVHDLNYLYKDLLEAKRNYNDSTGNFGDAGDEYLTMMHAVQAISGVKDPVNPKSAEQGVKGLLRFAIGVGDSPKHATFHRKVIGTAVDTVGRGTITGDPDLDMDEVGMPAEMAWSTFRPFVIRRLVRQGIHATDAVTAVKDRTGLAKKALEEEMSERPVVYNRAPSLHKFNYVGAWAKLRDSDSIGLPYATLKGIGGDYDGDNINIHVPAGAEAVRDVTEKMMPSKNLLHPATYESHLEPMQDYLAGLYMATRPDHRQAVKTFATVHDARKAFSRGEISLATPIKITEPQR